VVVVYFKALHRKCNTGKWAKPYKSRRRCLFSAPNTNPRACEQQRDFILCPTPEVTSPLYSPAVSKDPSALLVATIVFCAITVRFSRRTKLDYGRCVNADLTISSPSRARRGGGLGGLGCRGNLIRVVTCTSTCGYDFCVSCDFHNEQWLFP
jgi:hypothetical protein